jgi:predicted DNA-binding protein
MTRPAPPLSIRLDADTERRLRRLAHETGGTLSSVVREAVAEYGDAHERRAAAAARPYDRLRHLIGSVEGPGDRSTRTGERFRAQLQANARARRAR